MQCDYKEDNFLYMSRETSEKKRAQIAKFDWCVLTNFGVTLFKEIDLLHIIAGNIQRWEFKCCTVWVKRGEMGFESFGILVMWVKKERYYRRTVALGSMTFREVCVLFIIIPICMYKNNHHWRQEAFM